MEKVDIGEKVNRSLRIARVYYPEYNFYHNDDIHSIVGSEKSENNACPNHDDYVNLCHGDVNKKGKRKAGKSKEERSDHQLIRKEDEYIKKFMDMGSYGPRHEFCEYLYRQTFPF